MNIKEQIANAEFGDKFIVRNGEPHPFISLIENAIQNGLIPYKGFWIGPDGSRNRIRFSTCK